MPELSLIVPWIAAGAAIITTILTVTFGFLFNRRLEQLKSQLDLQIHVHRVKFEKEFQVLQEVWERLVDLRNAGAAFTPGVKWDRPEESECRKRFAQAYYKLWWFIEVQKPFFPQEVYDLLQECRKRQFQYFLNHEFIRDPDFQSDWVSPEFWARRDENLKVIKKLTEDVCEAIRKRAGGAIHYAES